MTFSLPPIVLHANEAHTCGSHLGVALTSPSSRSKLRHSRLRLLCYLPLQQPDLIQGKEME